MDVKNYVKTGENLKQAVKLCMHRHTLTSNLTRFTWKATHWDDEGNEDSREFTQVDLETGAHQAWLEEIHARSA